MHGAAWTKAISPISRRALRTVTLISLLLWLAGAATAAGTGGPDAQVLLRRYAAWRGGEAFEQLRSTHAKGRLTTSGLEGDIEIWTAAGGARWEHSAVDGIVEVENISSRGGWRTNLSGQVIPLDDAATSNLRLQASVLFASILRSAQAEPQLKPDEKLDNADWHVVELTYPEGVFDFFLADGGELHAVRVSRAGSIRLTRYEDWRFVSGVRLPFLERQGVAADGDTRRLTRIELNTRPPPMMSRRLHDRLVASSLGNGSRWIDFELLGGRRIYLPLTINGLPVKALLDSGAEVTVLDASLAKAAAIKPIGQMQVLGSGGSAPSGLATGVTISTGRERLSPVTVSVMDLASVGKALEIPLQAILGQEAFQAFVVDIDFEHRRIAFRDPATFVAPPGARRLPLTPAEGDRITRLSVEGRPPIDVIFDLGNGSPLDLFPAYWQAQNLLNDRPSSEHLNGGAGGQRPVKVATIETVDLGGVLFHKVPTNFPPSGATTADSHRVQGNLGLPILSRFRVIVDFPHSALFLVPRQGANEQPFDRDRSGLSVVRDAAGLKVTFVAPGSPAQEAGLQVGDLIVSIDGRPIDPAGASSTAADWRNGPAGRRVILSLAGDRSLSLTLRDYF